MGNHEKQIANRDLLRNEIYFNIKKYYNRIINYNEIVSLYKDAVEFNEKALENESTKLKLGTSTVINVVQLQNNYTIAMGKLHEALLNLNTSIIYFRFHTGTLCELSEEFYITVNINNLFSLQF